MIKLNLIEIEKLFFFIMMWCLSISIVLAQTDKSSIKGKVYDENGDAIENAAVLIAETRKGTSTNVEGNYFLKNVRAGNITIRISRVGYKTKSRQIVVTEGINNLDFTLASKTEELSEVIVSGAQDKGNRAVVSVNRLNSEAIDMPNSASSISWNLTKQQQAIRLSEALRNVAGVYMFNKSYGGASETVGARGISLRYLGFMFRDGIRFGTHQYMAAPELQAYERIEILKGGAAINFGYISPGATINYITKKPSLAGSNGSVSLRAGSYSFFKPSLDYNLKISDRVAARFISTAEVADSFRDVVKTRRTYNSGSLLFKATEKTDFLLNVDYLHEKTPVDFGMPVFGNRIITGYKTEKDEDGKDKRVPIYMQTSGTQKIYDGVNDRARFLGSSFNNRNSSQINSNLSVNHRFNDTWNLNVRAAASISGYDWIQTGSGFYNRYEYDAENDDIKITRIQQKDEWKENTYGALANLVGEVRLLSGINNKISVSVDYDNRMQVRDRYPNVMDFDQIYLKKQNSTAPERPQEEVNKQSATTTNFQDIGLSFQNLVQAGEHINVLLSVRADKVMGYNETEYFEDVGNNKKGDRTKTTHDAFAFTPSLGLVYKVTPDHAIYASYTNSFNPNTRGYLDVNNNVLPPYRTNQYEVGTKNTFLEGKMTANLALYMINDNRYLQVPGSNDNVYEVSPGSKYRGIEIESMLNLAEGLTVGVNYSYIEAKYFAGSWVREGSRPQQTPTHQIGFWSRYKFTRGILKNFSVNAGGEYTGERFGDDHRVSLGDVSPYIQRAFTLLNAGVAYEANRWDLQLKMTNLLNEFVFFSYRNGSLNPIDPTQFAVTGRFKF